MFLFPFLMAAFPRGDAPGVNAPGVDVFLEQKLASGVRLSVLQVKDAPRQTFLGFLPLGLAHDDAGRAQWSHLLEHMLIRTTDPEGLTDGTIVFNGETSDGSLRLDVHAPPEQAPLAAAKLVAWLSANTFDADALAREKQNIASEIANTASRGFAHKWATAAWAQVVRHGAKDAAVQGDVEGATIDGLEAYADLKLLLGPRVRIVAIGPLPPEEVKGMFETQFSGVGGLDSLANALGGNPRAGGKGGVATSAEASGGKPADLAHGELAATWDLPSIHLIEWYVLPDATPADRASATTIASLLMMKLQSDAGLAKAKISAVASADVVLPQGRVLFLSASLPDAASREVATAAFRRAIDTLDQVPQVGTLDAFLTMARNETAALPDFAALRKQWKGRPNADLIEAQIGLSLAAREWSTRLSFAELGDASQAMTVKEFLARRARDLGAERASRLLLTPRP